MSSIIVRLSGPSGFNYGRPIRSSRDVRGRAVDKGTPSSTTATGKATPTGAPAAQPVPGWALVAPLCLAAAGPLYGYQRSMKEIKEAKAKWAAEQQKKKSTTASVKDAVVSKVKQVKEAVVPSTKGSTKKA
eukprot:CAMPEP_0202920084 /NCGR_PEP_ID=MMETSP1392-20130828/76671_1 /ASSEMBLY_ACC=CAM_ASM_000868 /TAXON_ID=225041 /ORGANISM="Chlamydomonas chlamydogama, Strain SAG 11-48b" /LENGTH=130 /DNA_ID=CAMNT_0049613567 /DNA_START=98 /DNA_END=490 /DNA_ORIENTATION=+